MKDAYREDVALMERIARGEAGAFRELSNLHLRAIVTFSNRLLSNHAEAEDVAQETFLRAWRHAESYQPRAKLSTWLHTIARNLAVDRLRRRGTRGEEFALDEERDAAPFSGRPSRLLMKKQEALSLKLALSTLSERQRSAILLCHEQGHDNQEIAVILESSVEAVESLLARGRRRLRELMSEEVSPGEETP